MNIGHSIKDVVGSDPSTNPSIPSLKRTLSSGSNNTNSVLHASRPQHLQQPQHHHTHHGPPPNLMGHLGVGMNTTEHFNTTNPNGNNTNTTTTAPPTMIRAVTSSGAYNRPNNTNSTSNTTTNQRMSTSTVQPSTTTRSVTATSPPMHDWRTFLTIEERQAVRGKIRDAYTNRCSSYEDLLQVACALEEELLHISAPSRLDYFKSGFEYENRVKLKKDQLQGQIASSLEAKRRSNSSPEAASNTTTTATSLDTSEDGNAKKQRR